MHFKSQHYHHNYHNPYNWKYHHIDAHHWWYFRNADTDNHDHVETAPHYYHPHHPHLRKIWISMTVYEWMMMMRISSNRYSRCRNMLHRNVTIQSVHWGYCSSVTAVSCHGNHYHHHHHHNWNTDASSLLQMYYGVSVPPVVVRTDNNMSISRIPDVKHSLTQPGHHDSMRVVSTNKQVIDLTETITTIW